jgi:hypothetical protein
MSALYKLGATALFGAVWLAGCGGDDDTTGASGKGGSAGHAGHSQGGNGGNKGGSGGTSNGGTSNGGTSNGGTGGSSAGAGEAGAGAPSTGGGAGRGGSGGASGAAAGESGQPGTSGESAGASAGANEGGAAGAGGEHITIRGCASTGDSAWSHVVALIPCQSSLDEATGLSTLTAYNTPTISASPAGAPGGASCSLGNGGSINTAKGFEVVMPSALGTGDFTVELSIYETQWHDPSDQQSEIIIADNQYPPAPMDFPTFFSHSGTDLVQYVGGSSVTPYADTTSALDTWETYAASRVDGTTYLFRNGVVLTSFPDATDYAGTTFHVSHQANGTYNALMGSVAQIRVTRGVGRYTTSYETCADGFATE